MKIHPASQAVRGEKSGAALLLSMLVLVVIGLLVLQINNVTVSDLKVARTDVTLTMMDLAIESTLLETGETLADDGAAAAAEDDSSDTEDGAGAGGEEPGSEAVDSKMDAWAQPQSTNIGDLTLRILIQDENSKFNILNMLDEDEDEAEDAFDRVVRVIDNFREGTAEDIDTAEAEEMARAMREHMQDRSDSYLPRARLLTDGEDDSDVGMPMTLREFVVLEPFEERHFRDYFDEDRIRVHGLCSFLTVYTSPGFGGDDSEDNEASSGYSVNINTAPLAVLNALFDPRDVDSRFWDGVIEYRNQEEERDPAEEEIEPALNEFGEEMLARKFFDNLEELEEVYQWGQLDGETQALVEEILSVESHVFSIYVTGRLSTMEEGRQMVEFSTREQKEEYDRSGTHIMRTVRSVVWRAPGDDGPEMVPLIRWEVLDYSPLEVLDFGDEDF